MKRHGLHGLPAALLILACVLPARAQDEAGVVLQHRETYFAEVRKLDAKFTGQREELDKKLAETVKALEARYVAEANLDGVIAAREVIEAIEDPFSGVVAPTRKNTDALARAIEQHTQQTRALDTEETRVRDELKAKYIAFLDRVKQKLTTERKIDEALALHNEIERLNNEMKRAQPAAQPIPQQPAQPAQPAAPQPAAPNPSTPPPPNPNARKFLSEAEVIEQLKTLGGTTITLNGRVKALEADGANRGAFLAVLEGGLKLRLNMPENTELAKRAGATYLKGKDPYRSTYYYTSYAGEDIILAGTKIAVQANVAKGVVHHTMPNTFLNTVLVGSDSAAVRRRFNADCGGPCPPLAQRYSNTRFCPVCGNERYDVVIRYITSP